MEQWAQAYKPEEVEWKRKDCILKLRTKFIRRIF